MRETGAISFRSYLSIRPCFPRDDTYDTVRAWHENMSAATENSESAKFQPNYQDNGRLTRTHSSATYTQQVGHASVSADGKKTNKEPRRNQPEEPQERELPTFPAKAAAQESTCGTNRIQISIPQLKISEAWQHHTLDTWRHISYVFWKRNPVTTTHCSCRAEGKEATLGISDPVPAFKLCGWCELVI